MKKSINHLLNLMTNYNSLQQKLKEKLKTYMVLKSGETMILQLKDTIGTTLMEI